MFLQSFFHRLSWVIGYGQFFSDFVKIYTDYRLCDFVLIRLTRKQGRSSKRKSVLVFLFAVFQLIL